MAEMEPGHPDELVKVLRNWLRGAGEPPGSLPPGMDAEEWAVRQFIAWWADPARGTIREIEDSIRSAEKALAEKDLETVEIELDSIRQLVGESLRDHLGLYAWDEERET